jgi:L-alanine-DL-glutamate epimerase-like enolase superfamily enzyme
MPFIVQQGCHIVQIDIPKAGGLLEAKKISDLAETFDMPVNSHNASGPLGAIASAQSEAAMRDFKAHEFSIGGLGSTPSSPPWGPTDGADHVKAWENLVIHDGPLLKDGRLLVPDKPCIGVEPNLEFIRAHLPEGETWWG